MPRFARIQIATRPAFAAAAAALLLGACAGDAGTDAVAIDCTAAARGNGVAYTGAADAETCRWLGIPFAEPPVGERRFAPAQIKPATGAIDATDYGNDCIQAASPMAEHSIDEDCLVLNIWTPGSSVDGSLRRDLPVMVWIYGGGYQLGSANWSLYNGAALAREGVVLVAVNYRLGALGGAAPSGVTAHDGAPLQGNLHVGDQWTALEWVQDHIADFGGDPDNVTIFGESAGGWSVCSMLGAGAADAGLIHRAIMQSGACFFDPATKAAEYSDEWLAAAGCPATGPAALDCLRDIDADRFRDDLNLGLLDGAYPNIDGDWFTRQPIAELRAGTASDIDFIAGFNHDELEVAALADPELIAFRYRDWDEFWRDVEAEMGADDRARMQELYPQDDFATPFDLGQAMIVDQVFGCPARDAVAAQRDAGANAYMYRFALEPDSFSLEPYIGSFHGLDVPFVFGNLSFLTAVVPNEYLQQALDHSARIRRYWTRFAATGDPNGGDDPAWPRFGAEARALELRPNAALSEGFLTDRCAFWNARLPDWGFTPRVDWILERVPGVEDASFFKR